MYKEIKDKQIIWYVDVGNIKPNKALKYINNIRMVLKKKGNTLK